MDAMDMEALLVRAKAVRKLVRNGTVTGEEGLALIVVPPIDLLAASMEKAHETGVSAETLELFAARASSRRKRSPGHVRGPLIVTVEELASEH